MGSKIVTNYKSLLGLIVCFAMLALVASSCGQGSSNTAQSQGTTNTGDYTTPWGMALNSSASLLYVAHPLLDQVRVYNPDSMKVVTYIDTACKPRHIAFSKDGSKLFVTHDSFSSQDPCYKSQTSYATLVSTYISVVNVSTGKVTKEIEVSMNNPRYIVNDPVYDVMYISSASNNKVLVVNAATEAVAGYLESATYGWTNPVRIRYDSSRSMLYVLDYDASKIYMLKPTDPANLEFTQYSHDAQSTGYCLGSNMRNGCACTANSKCASGDCSTGDLQPICNSSCGSGEDGCTCSADGDCDSGNCVDSVCKSITSIVLDDIAGYCDISDYSNIDTSRCFSESDAENQKPHLKEIEECSYPADILALDNDIALVSCFGDFTSTAQDPVYMLMWNDAGLARTGDAVADMASNNYCDKPSTMAVQKGTNPTYAFVLCFGNSSAMVYEIATGEMQGVFSAPANPIDIVATTNRIFITSSTANSIQQYSIPVYVNPF